MKSSRWSLFRFLIVTVVLEIIISFKFGGHEYGPKLSDIKYDPKDPTTKLLLKMFGFKSKPNPLKKIQIHPYTMELYKYAARQNGQIVNDNDFDLIQPKQKEKVEEVFHKEFLANIIRSFSHAGDDWEDDHKVDSMVLKFNLSSIPSHHKQRAAELRIAHIVHPSAPPMPDKSHLPPKPRWTASDIHHLHRVRVFDIMEPATESKPARNRFFAAKIVDARENGSVSIDVSEPLHRWSRNPKSNHGLLVEIEPFRKNQPSHLYQNASHIRLRRDVHVKTKGSPKKIRSEDVLADKKVHTKDDLFVEDKKVQSKDYLVVEDEKVGSKSDIFDKTVPSKGDLLVEDKIVPKDDLLAEKVSSEDNLLVEEKDANYEQPVPEDKVNSEHDLPVEDKKSHEDDLPVEHKKVPEDDLVVEDKVDPKYDSSAEEYDDWEDKMVVEETPMPILVVHIDDGGAKKRTRRRSGTEVDKEAIRKRKTSLCQRYEMNVDFKRVEWRSWILAPAGYNAYFCQGRCPFPLADHMNETNHAVIQNIVHSRSPGRVHGACCVPVNHSAISMLYVDEDTNVVLKNYQDMVVESCGCR